jgi:ADP-ribose pyrophosphatase YjhB (NUDIX family)
MDIEKFNVRVYGVLMKGNAVLLADENINGFEFTKFPGGGVELGEGIIDALKRELMEEGEIQLLSASHFYTTDFFQVSAFNPKEQIISVYYKVQASIEWEEKFSDQSIPNKKHSVKLYFKNLDEINEDDLTFPIDKKVMEMLKKEYQG